MNTRDLIYYLTGIVVIGLSVNLHLEFGGTFVLAAVCLGFTQLFIKLTGIK